MGKIRGTIVDAVSGESLAAKVGVLPSNGRPLRPSGSLEKRGPGRPFFFCEGEFEVAAPRGQADVTVERGTEYTPFHAAVEVPEKGDVDLRIELKRWADLASAGWYPGNTHIHYDDKETRAYERLRYDADVETYNVTVVSILQRWDLNYASNRFPVGVMTDYTSSHHVLDVGEENRHNAPNNDVGYGHVMFLRIRNQVEPVSRGFLVDDFHPDYPPLCYACDDAREQGGITIWCHNGRGMEAPVAAALGKLDAFNLFDPYWMDPEYDLWYRMLNCGLNLPASTGTDWFVCSNNRVYVQLDDGAEFSYASWIEGMKAGRTYITNGPAVDLKANDSPIGSTLELDAGTGEVEAQVSFRSYYPIDAAEIVVNGSVVHRKEWLNGLREGTFNYGTRFDRDGWIAVRLWGNARDSFDHSIYAHSSPIYIRCGRAPLEREDAARFFLDSIGDSLKWIDTVGRYNDDRQRQDVKDLFRRGEDAFRKLDD